jgi:hypothetical protein
MTRRILLVVSNVAHFDDPTQRLLNTRLSNGEGRSQWCSTASAFLAAATPIFT